MPRRRRFKSDACWRSKSATQPGDLASATLPYLLAASRGPADGLRFARGPFKGGGMRPHRTQSVSALIKRSHGRGTEAESLPNS